MHAPCLVCTMRSCRKFRHRAFWPTSPFRALLYAFRLAGLLGFVLLFASARNYGFTFPLFALLLVFVLGHPLHMLGFPLCYSMSTSFRAGMPG
ncbi:hypothetical protein HDF10_001353 [Edaphobacter lichenicola]|uniref:Uncharacterized protein n=1 Tax=Tunturiibacter lichenicola TaxID=2051959 RepID=A0A7W8J6D3_9BACT|nr:hypothetical protein [Edaphobacter lichenicola]